MVNKNFGDAASSGGIARAPTGMILRPARFRTSIAAFAACAVLAGCASQTGVVKSGKPGTYTVAASATGGRMAWARAHEQAIQQAHDYCERLGMQSSIKAETVSGVAMLTEHESSLDFECHPKF